MWSQADKNDMCLKSLSNHGWALRSNDILTIVWDSKVNIDAVRERVSHLLSGCKCVTGCTTKRCSCRKRQVNCSEGCQCHNCCNLCPLTTTNEATSELELNEQLNEEIDDMLDLIFNETNENTNENTPEEHDN